MTHFVGLVVAESEDEIAALVQPYHEYECTGVEDQYVVDVDTTDQLHTDFKAHRSEGQNFEDFAARWDGSKRHEDGRYYRRTNPNAKWDWWVVGGRWYNTAPGDNCLAEEVPTFFSEYTPSVTVDLTCTRYQSFLMVTPCTDEMGRCMADNGLSANLCKRDTDSHAYPVFTHDHQI